MMKSLGCDTSLFRSMSCPRQRATDGRSAAAYEEWREANGLDHDDLLVIRAPSAVLNPTLDRLAIRRQLGELANSTLSRP
jgi:hypothetical protein